MNFFILQGRTCREVIVRCDEFVDNEMSGEAAAGVIHHLMECADCAELIAATREMKTVIRDGVRNIAIPSSLRRNVGANIRSCTT